MMNLDNKSNILEPQATVWSTVCAGLMIGATYGYVVGAYDIVFRAPNISADYVTVVMFFYMAVGSGAGFLMALGSMLALRITHNPATLRNIAALMTGLAMCLVVLVVSGRKMTLVAFPVSIFIALLIVRSWPCVTWRVLIAWWLLSLFVAIALSLACASGVMPDSIFLSGVIYLALAVAVLTQGRRLCERSSKAVSVCTTACILLSAMWSISTFSQSLRNLPDTPHHRGSGHPNVVIIVLDTLRQDYLGVYGHDGGLTPNLDQLATESTVYESAFSTAPWTVPSHGSMFTGFYPKTHGASSQDHLWLDDVLLTMPEAMRLEGYQTISVVANVTIEQANFDKGFDQHVFLHAPKSRVSLMLTPLIRLLGLPCQWMDKGSASSIVELGNWFQSDYDPEKPLFLFVNIMDSHEPYQPPIKHRLAQLPHGRSLIEAARLGAIGHDATAWHASQVDDPRKIELARAMYSAEVAYQDEQVGRMIQLLKKTVDLDETLLIITSDHGENLGEAKRWGHLFSINDYLLHVPLLMRYPEKFPPAKRINGLCQLTDLLPTVFDVLDIPCPVENLPGQSLVPEKFEPADAIFAQWWPFHWMFPDIIKNIGRQASREKWTAHYRVVRTQDYKYIWSSDGRHSLYDVKHDEDEAFNIITQEPEIAKRLNERLWKWWNEQPDYQHTETEDDQPLDAQAIEMLKSIGYIGD